MTNRTTAALSVCLLTALIIVGLRLVPTTAQQAPMATTRADPARLKAFVTAINNGLPYIPGELLVQFKDGIGETAQRVALSSVRTTAGTSTATWIGDTLLLTGLGESDSEQSAAIMRRQPGVEFAQPNYIRRLHAIPNDPGYAQQWNMGQIKMPQAWDINSGAGVGVTVAVLDTGLTQFEGGVNFRLPLLPNGQAFGVFAIPFSRPPDFNTAKIQQGVEFTSTGPWTVAGQPLLFDAEGHGTHVSGTIAEQSNNSVGFAGVASGATVLPVKVCTSVVDVVMAWGAEGRLSDAFIDGCVDSDVIDGIRYAVDHDAKVLNISLGGAFPSPAYVPALNYAVSRGAFVTISAGNAALEGNPTEYPAAYAANIAGVVAVGATTLRNTRALYSNTGSYVELSAPGGECESLAEVVWQVGPDQDALFDFPPRFDRYVPLPSCGTSMASPHVAGAAALLRSQGIINPAAIEAALERFAVDLGAPGRDPQFGFGLIDVRAALLGLGYAK